MNFQVRVVWLAMGKANNGTNWLFNFDISTQILSSQMWSGGKSSFIIQNPPSLAIFLINVTFFQLSFWPEIPMT